MSINKRPITVMVDDIRAVDHGGPYIDLYWMRGPDPEQAYACINVFDCETNERFIAFTPEAVLDEVIRVIDEEPDGRGAPHQYV